MVRHGAFRCVLVRPIQSHAHTDILQSHRGANLPDAFANIQTAQMLSVTADNTSSNDTLVMELADLNAHFTVDTSQTRCFLHIVNLVAKLLICKFDAPKSKASMADDPELVKLTADIEIEDTQTAEEDPNKDTESEDNEEGWVNELYLLDEEERGQLMDSIHPLH